MMFNRLEEVVGCECDLLNWLVSYFSRSCSAWMISAIISYKLSTMTPLCRHANETAPS